MLRLRLLLRGLLGLSTSTSTSDTVTLGFVLCSVLVGAVCDQFVGRVHRVRVLV